MIRNFFAFNQQQLVSNKILCRYVRTTRKRVLPVPKSTKRLDVVIMGEPNVGKSVLLNCLIKTKLAATTRKRHTTRGEILGVFNHRNTQLAFYDTPGFVSKAEALRNDMKTLRDIAEDSAGKADVIMIVIDAARSGGSKNLHAFAEVC